MRPVVLNSLPKSGTHLLVRLFDLIGYDDANVHLSGSLVRPYVGKNIIRKATKKIEVFFDRTKKPRFEVDLDDPSNDISHERFKRILSNVVEGSYCEAHLPYSIDLSQKLSETLGCVYIVRDPRAVVVSYINHVSRDPNYPLHKVMQRFSNFDDCVRLVLEGASNSMVTLAPVSDRVKNSVGWYTDNSVCSLKFEELIGPKGGGSKSSQEGAISKVLDFLHLDSQNPNILAEQIFDSNSETFFKGSIDGWRSFLKEETIDLLSSEFSTSLRLLGYE